jgi:hypothetical protein
MILYNGSTDYGEDQADSCFGYGATGGPANGATNGWLYPVETYGTTHRESCAWNGSTVNVCLRGSCAAVADTSVPVTSTRVYVGINPGGNEGRDATISDVCADSSSSRCKAYSYASNNAIAYLGDSLVLGNVADTHNRLPHELDKLAGRAVFNFGFSGRQMHECLTEFRNSIKGKGYRTLVVACAVNSIAHGLSAASVLASLDTIRSEAQADGMQVVVTTVFPWKNAVTWSSGFQTVTNTYNASLPAWAAANNVTLVDPYSTLGGEGGDPDILLAAYDTNGDHIHIGAAGNKAVAALIAAGLPAP